MPKMWGYNWFLLRSKVLREEKSAMEESSLERKGRGA